MFKKLKDKLAEEVKSSPQRIRQFAQAAQAAVTSASSSVSDITNNDLFSIGDNDSTQNRQTKQMTDAHQKEFKDVQLSSPSSTADLVDYQALSFAPDRQRRLSNSSLASDVSFKLPSYESPSMYHLQSDMDISASEAEDRYLVTPGGGSLERVTKEQLYAAYRRTQERYKKYRAQYSDLARHYKILERENAKAKSVLVETQDKALRGISELREQCSLEQSAKAHLERALRIELEEKSMKIETLSTKINILQNNCNTDESTSDGNSVQRKESVVENIAPLVDLSIDSTSADTQAASSDEISALNNKIEKMEQLINKYKESLKSVKEKNTQLTTELQSLTNEIETKNKEHEKLNGTAHELAEAQSQIQQLKDINEDIQNKLNTYDFNKTKEASTLETELEKAREEIKTLQQKVSVFTKREEENAISLAENKLSIHKELESKETEIKSLKESLAKTNQEIQSLNIIINDYKKQITISEEEQTKLSDKINKLDLGKNMAAELEKEMQSIKDRYQKLEQSKLKIDEEYKCLQLQLKQETAEKLAMIDRNSYLEDRNKQLVDENTKKSNQVTSLENKLVQLKSETQMLTKSEDEVHVWKGKYQTLESEIQEERIELVKLQAEIEKMIKHHEFVQAENTNLQMLLSEVTSQNDMLNQQVIAMGCVKNNCLELQNKLFSVKELLTCISDEIRLAKETTSEERNTIEKTILSILNKLHHESEYNAVNTLYTDAGNANKELQTELIKLKEVKELLQKQNTDLKAQIEELKEKKTTCEETANLETSKELIKLKEMYDEKVNQLKEIENEKTQLTEKLQECEEKLYISNNDYEMVQNTHAAVVKELESNKSELANLLHKQEELQQLNNKIQNDLDNLQEKYEATVADLLQTKENNDNLQSQVNELDIKNKRIQELESDIKQLNKEIKLSKENSNGIVGSFKELEKQLLELQESHSQIVKEKDQHIAALTQSRQNEVKKREEIEQLQKQLDDFSEENNTLKLKCEKIKQEKEVLHEKLLALEQKHTEYETLIQEHEKSIEENEALKTKLISVESEYDVLTKEVTAHKEVISVMSSSKENLEKIDNDALKLQNDTMREENRRLQSDIEGLQSYLTKISKENSVLNDKLRDTIATSESTESSETKELLESVAKLQSEIESEKEKTNDLLRQNSLLEEENLELKDQLQSHSFSFEPKANPTNDSQAELASLKENYDKLLKSKQRLENKLNDMESFQSSKNANVEQLQASNNKLRLSNEKLERRLDEALVSLRHLHSLQENTELEYLKNILYEYLTGSGTHSITLAKVLAAVVKFSDQQTNAIMQKEKERQGLLRQLGLL